VIRTIHAAVTTARKGATSTGDDLSVPGTGQARTNGIVASVHDLHVSFARRGAQIKALRGVDLEFRAGEIVGLVGESGSGKSVLGLSLLGLLPVGARTHVSGTAEVCGIDMAHASARDRRRVRRTQLGAVFQDPMTSLNPTMRIGRQVVEATGSVDEAVRLLDAVGIPEPRRRLGSYPHELSGGLRQRVMIAMAIAGRPTLVVADEPTTALDVTVQAQILELLTELRNELGSAFVFITHDLGVAAQIADRIAVLYAGRLAEVGPTAAVLDDPVHPYTRGLLRSRLRMRAERSRPLATLPGEPPDPRQHPPGCAFGPRCALVTDACLVALPELVEHGPVGRSVACVHADEAHTADTPGGPTVDAGAALRWPAAKEPAPDIRGALRLVDVHKTYWLKGGFRTKHRLEALRGVSLEVPHGASVALVGESGCGKSTLLRVVAGLVPAESGAVELASSRRPQMVFQDAGASLTPWMTVGEIVSERLRYEGLSRSARLLKVAETLSLVGLPEEVAHAKASHLSGGQRQRVAIARAVVVPPDVLLCDEPTSALDVSLAATVLNLLGRLRRELGMSLLFVTHDLAAARVVADRVAVMYLGRIVEEGQAEAMAHAPAHPYTRALLSAVPSPGASRVALAGEPASPLRSPPGCAFHPRCPIASAECAHTPPQLLAMEGEDDRRVACIKGPTRAGPAEVVR
jgi:peptide/nickel transport system ATP-binding protein